MLQKVAVSRRMLLKGLGMGAGMERTERMHAVPEAFRVEHPVGSCGS